MRADAKRNADRLREAAHEVFLARGLDVPLEQIARRAGVSIGTLYNRFGGRDGLLDAAVGDSATDRLEDAIEQAHVRSDPWERFAAFLGAIFAAQAIDPAFSDAVSRARPGAPRLHDVHERMLAYGDGLVRAARAEGLVRDDFERSDLARAVWANGNLVRAHPGDDRQWRRDLAYLLDGLRRARRS
jgi:AcrR family transcriptional regulator